MNEGYEEARRLNRATEMKVIASSKKDRSLETVPEPESFFTQDTGSRNSINKDEEEKIVFRFKNKPNNSFDIEA